MALQSAGVRLVEAVAEGPRHAWGLAERGARDGYGVIAAAGGDGTIHEVVNGLRRGRPERPPALAVIPVGTANILVRALGLPRIPAQSRARCGMAFGDASTSDRSTTATTPRSPGLGSTAR